MADAGLFNQDAGQISRLQVARHESIGKASIEWYDQWANTKDPQVKERILAYNEDDCVATRVLLEGIRALGSS